MPTDADTAGYGMRVTRQLALMKGVQQRPVERLDQPFWVRSTHTDMMMRCTDERTNINTVQGTDPITVGSVTTD